MNLDQKVNYFHNLRTGNYTEQPFNLSFMPENEVQAYNIQKEVIKKLGFPVVGWKLGGTNSKTQQNFNCNSAYLGPVFSVNNTKPCFLDYDNIRGEAELTFRLGLRIESLSIDEIKKDPLQFFDMVYPSLELPFSSITNFKEVGMLPLIADLCGTGHLSLGAPSNLSSLDEVASSIKICSDKCVLAKGMKKNLIGGYKTVLADFLKLVLMHNLDVKAGQYVATGGLTDCIVIGSNTLVDIDFEGLEIFSVIY